MLALPANVHQFVRCTTVTVRVFVAVTCDDVYAQIECMPLATKCDRIPFKRAVKLSVEAQFARAGITTDDTKYYTFVAEIDSAILMHASDIIASPPTTGKYEALKERLLAEFGESTEKRLKRLFKSCELNDKKPTTLLREMKDLAHNRLDKSILKSIWLRRLPLQVQQILTTLDEDVEVLAKRADSIMEVTTTNVVNAVNAPNNSNVEVATIADLEYRLDRLEQNNRNRFQRMRQVERNSAPRLRPTTTQFLQHINV
ncbi:PREDICTED: uncharacterized protein LOC108359920 [Rhagoletis zephyria]|uniref:uncharacterized protein LOC108359920 n=1 Tax=Rhagoletis zephyria TaxID=28612 RepID=UPI0008116A88|nr:PREDICTED: uncharacterized protein LOC108359920 [Rhagoletis zephyria]